MVYICRDGISVISWDHDENENDEHDEDPVTNMSMDNESVDGESDVTTKSGRKHPFFHRSDSTTFLGCPPPDPFQTPLVQALPLADQPHLLQPNARREDLFGMIRQTVIPFRSSSDMKSAQKMSGSRNQFDKLPIRMALSERRPGSCLIQPGTLPMATVPAPLNQPGPSHLPDVAFSSASVIVKPPSQTLSTQMAASQQSVDTNLVSSIPLPGQSVEPFKSHEMLNQASVIVHSSGAQGLQVPGPAYSGSPLPDPRYVPGDRHADKVSQANTQSSSQDRSLDTQSPSMGSLPTDSSGTSLMSGVTTQCSTGGTSSLAKSSTESSGVSMDALQGAMMESRSLQSLSSESMSDSAPFPDQTPGPSTMEMADQRPQSSSDGPSMQAR